MFILLGKIEFIEIPTSQIPTIKTEQLLNLGIVIKSAAIVETIEEFLKVNEGKNKDA